ncbi:MAG: MGMT family protein [Candidatus Dojkabacteria bacterium]|nr:MAG: MGMT family protein [Candidatus Dojkabacteria bacterium]
MKYFEQVYEVVNRIPEGKVATYGQVASILGNPRAARVVGYALRLLTDEERQIPWWRVVNAKGFLSIDHGHGGFEKVLQADLLRDEGVKVDDQFILELESYLWDGR